MDGHTDNQTEINSYLRQIATLQDCQRKKTLLSEPKLTSSQQKLLLGQGVQKKKQEFLYITRIVVPFEPCKIYKPFLL